MYDLLIKSGLVIDGTGCAGAGRVCDAVSERDTVALQVQDAMLQPVVASQAAYPFFAALARARGMDPDSPPHLRKITRTV